VKGDHRQEPPDRVLILAPTRKDGELAQSVLDRAGVPSLCCATLSELRSELEEGAGAVLLSEEAASHPDARCFSQWLASQPPWSDLPVLVLARQGADSATVGQAIDVLRNVTVIERPVRVAALVSTVRSALRARQRQYETRAQLAHIERSEQELRDFFDNATVGLHWLGPDGIIQRVNEAELAMLGYARSEVIGHHIDEFYADSEVIHEILQRLKNHETINNREARLRCKDGSIKHVLVDSSVLWENGRFVHTRCFTRDVTDRKRAEEALKKADQRKDEFLATLAHELRNPLAPIQNSLHILRLTGGDSASSEQVAEMMERQVKHMVRLVDDLMEVSRITRGKIELQKEVIDVASIVRSAVETSMPLINAAHHHLDVELPPVAITVEGDLVRLTQVVANLLNNAAKYTDDGGNISLAIRKETDQVAISVRDNGTGIASDDLPQLFEMFTQAEHNSSRTKGGLGIGLTLAKSLVEMHRGSIDAFSAGLGKGSEFTVRLPLTDVSGPSDASGSEARHSSLDRRRLLIVDDNRDAAESLATLLRLLGADAHAVYSGAEALEELKKYDADAVVLDIGMPDMNGLEVARRIRGSAEHRRLVLIALTGWGQEEDRRRSQSAGFDYHLIKPTDLRALEELLASLDRESKRHLSAHCH